MDDRMILNKYGHIVKTEWMKTMHLRPNVILDHFVIMPNHFHGIVNLNLRRGTARRAPTDVNNRDVYERFGKPIPNSLPTIIRSFKSAVTKQINTIRKRPGDPIWQRGFHDHIIRDDDDLNRIREYIFYNPLKWALDNENPARRKMKSDRK